MTNVADEQLGKLARQQADLFRRVREGSLDAEYVSTRLQDIIEGKDDKLAGSTFPIIVDYGRSVEDGVKAGRYDQANSDITSRNFPITRKGTDEIVVELVHFNRNISTDEALHELDRMDYRLAELHELLAFGEKYPEVQRGFLIVALGSVWQDRVGDRRVPYLFGVGSGRRLFLGWVVGDWGVFCRFAAVRK